MIFNKLKHKRKMKCKDGFKHIPKLKCFKPMNVINDCMRILMNNELWLCNIYQLISKLSIKQCVMLSNFMINNDNIFYYSDNDDKYSRKTLFKQMNAIIRDLINFKIHHRHSYLESKSKSKSKIDNVMIKVKYINKGIELLKLETIFNHKSIVGSLPSFCKFKKPTIIYNYLPPIRNKIFNYNEVIDNIDTLKDIECDCKSSKYCHDKLDHIVTGNMEFVQNDKLKSIMNYGTNYRVPTKVDWDKVMSEIKSSINNLIKVWSNKEKLCLNVFNEWKNKVLECIKYRVCNLKSISKYGNNNYQNIWKNKDMLEELNRLHDKYVIVNADKCSNNIIIICKKYYISCMIKELKLNKLNTKSMYTRSKCKPNNDDTYLFCNEVVTSLIDKHNIYMHKNNITIPENMMKLPKLYMIPKMHKYPPKERYIAASNSCTTKPLSNIITKCLKLITLQHRKYCKVIEEYTGVNRMWIIDNSKNVLETIEYYNDNDNIKNINSYDFSTLYTKIPHKDLKEKIIWVVEKAFYNKSKSHIYVNNHIATWNKRNNTHVLDKDKLIEYICYLIDNIYISVNNKIFRQIIGIPMGTDCAPFLANLYLYALEFKFLDNLTKEDIPLARKFSNSYRYIDDLIMFNNNGLMDEYKYKIYPKELILNKENKNDQICNFLDIHMNIMNHKIITSIYDKRDDFNFKVNSFPNLSGNIHSVRTHGVIISQLLRYAKVCLKVEDFINRSKIMITTLLNQFFKVPLLKQKFSIFYDKYYNIIHKYNYSKNKLIKMIF